MRLHVFISSVMLFTDLLTLLYNIFRTDYWGKVLKKPVRTRFICLCVLQQLDILHVSSFSRSLLRVGGSFLIFPVYSVSTEHIHELKLNEVQEMPCVPCLIESKQMVAGFHK